ncbi:MAG: hypothetical protein Fur0037_14270 [Planctomycetota bacterium]
MTGSPSDRVAGARGAPDAPLAMRRALSVLAAHGAGGLEEAGTASRSIRAVAATALMDLYRRTSSSEVFEALVGLTAPDLLLRIRSRLHRCGLSFDPHEILQDALVNIFRYPDRFRAKRPGAFAAWSSAIADNAIRRKLREARSGPDVSLCPVEILEQEPDRRGGGPSREAEEREEALRVAGAFGLVLQFYLLAYESLSQRERRVLRLVEVERLRYSALGRLLGMRPEAVKMVVFRARKRIFDRMRRTLSGAGAVEPHRGDRLRVA